MNITQFLSQENEVVVAVDNSKNEYVYPQNADFTFYGGIYINVNLLYAPKVRFDLEYYGSLGIKVTPIVEGLNALVETEAFVTGADVRIRFCICYKSNL